MESVPCVHASCPVQVEYECRISQDRITEGYERKDALEELELCDRRLDLPMRECGLSIPLVQRRDQFWLSMTSKKQAAAKIRIGEQVLQNVGTRFLNETLQEGARVQEHVGCHRHKSLGLPKVTSASA